MAVYVGFGLTASLKADTPWRIHIALREDGVIGEGTESDPYDGSAADRLRAIVENAPDGAQFLFGPGVFDVGPGIAVGDGKSLSFIGSGRTVTVLRLQDHLPSGGSRENPAGGIVLNVWGSDSNFSSKSALYVSDLTLDANVDGSPNSEHFTADALHTNYPTVVAERLRIINCGGSENYPTESFHVLAWYPNPDSEFTRAWTWYQRFNDIQILVKAGQTRTATVLSVGSSMGQPPIVPATGYAIVENCIFEVSANQDNTFAACVGAPNGAVFRNNVMVMRGKATAMNVDTWNHRGVTVEGNKISLHERASGVRVGSGPNTGTFRNDLFRDNQFFVASDRIGYCLQLHGVTQAEISRNQFLSLDGASGQLVAVDINNTYIPNKNSQITIRNNLVDTDLYQFPVAVVRGSPRNGVIVISEGNRSVDGTLGDGSENGLVEEHSGNSEITLKSGSPSTQIIRSTKENLRVRLPRVSSASDDRGSVFPGTRFTVINDGNCRILLTEPIVSHPLMPNEAATLVATRSKWIIVSRSGTK